LKYRKICFGIVARIIVTKSKLVVLGYTNNMMLSFLTLYQNNNLEDFHHSKCSLSS